MTIAGWIFMAVFWTFILGTAAWCLRIVLTEKQGKEGGGDGAAKGGGDAGKGGVNAGEGVPGTGG